MGRSSHEHANALSRERTSSRQSEWPAGTRIFTGCCWRARWQLAHTQRLGGGLQSMQHSLRLAYFAHSLRSDWNNGNAHFLRGLLRALRCSGAEVTAYEPESAWSIENLKL